MTLLCTCRYWSPGHGNAGPKTFGLRAQRPCSVSSLIILYVTLAVSFALQEIFCFSAKSFLLVIPYT